jgi:hypothetical protein
VDHGDGTVVEVDVAGCLPWNGTSNTPTRMAITAAQAQQIAANPAWGATQMDAALVRDADSRFAGVPGNSRTGLPVSAGSSYTGRSTGSSRTSVSAGS